MTTSAYDYNYKDCEKIDGRQVNAYVEAHLNNEDPTLLEVESTWGDSEIDLDPAVKAAETVTTLELVPEGGPTSLQYTKEDGTVDCIDGNDLSEIIKLKLLHDVDHEPEDGDVYVYDEETDSFKTFNLNAFVQNVTNALGDLDQAIGQFTTINTRLGDLETNVSNIMDILTPPTGSPSDVKVAFGNINIYGDYTGNNGKTSGIYTHNPSTNVANDQMFE